MTHCHDEHCDHDHGDLPDAGDQFNLYSRIDHDNWLESDADEELIVHVPFTGTVKLRSICLRTDPGESAPATLKVFINRDGMDFDAAQSYTPTQTWELVQGHNDVLEYSTRITKFTNVRTLTLFFPDNFGGDTSIVRFLGFKGEWTELKRDPIITVYEANANPADHKNPAGENKMDYSIQ